MLRVVTIHVLTRYFLGLPWGLRPSKATLHRVDCLEHSVLNGHLFRASDEIRAIAASIQARRRGSFHRGGSCDIRQPALCWAIPPGRTWRRRDLSPCRE
jgi:hypothetical protein